MIINRDNNKHFVNKATRGSVLSYRLMDLNEPVALAITILAISLVFGSRYLLIGELTGFVIVSFIVSLSIVIHELSHKYTAIHLGCYSRYVLHPLGLILTLVSAIPFIPIKIIMPGVTLVSLYTYDPFIVRKINGLTSLAGPLSNIVLALVAIAMNSLTYPYLPLLWRVVLILMLRVNSWIALFNLIPIPPLDGSKVLSWNPLIWITLFILSVILYLLSII